MKVLFIGPVFYDYHKIVLEKIKDLGAEVTFFPEKKDGFLFGILNTINPNLIFIYQIFYYKYLLKKINNQQFTHFFLIRGYKLPDFFLIKLKEKNPRIKFIMYQWDSNQNNHYFHILKHFDKSYTFDFKDFKDKEGLDFLQLFYTEDIKQIRENNNSNKYDLFCFSSFTMDRYKSMLKLIDFCEQNKLTLKTFCYIPKSTYWRFRYLKRVNLNLKHLSFEPMSRQDYLEVLSTSSVVVDFSHNTQTGLSMRIIEALGAGKKIWTTNRSILENPIYSSSRIQILDIDKLEIPVFIEEGNVISVEGLGIDSWIDKIFNK